MKPVVVLTLIASALSGKPRAEKRATPAEPAGPITPDEASHELVVAVVVVVVLVALLLALVLSFASMPEL